MNLCIEETNNTLNIDGTHKLMGSTSWYRITDWNKKLKCHDDRCIWLLLMIVQMRITS